MGRIEPGGAVRVSVHRPTETHEARRPASPGNVHQRERLFPDRIGAFLVIAQSLPALGQLIAPPLMRSGDALAGEGRTAGNIEEMAIDIVLHALEIGGFKMTIENARALQEQLANEAIAQLRKNGNNELVDDCIQSIAVVGKA